MFLGVLIMAERRGPYWNKKFNVGDYVDHQHMFTYIGEDGMTNSGYRRIKVRNELTGEEYAGIATTIINNNTYGSKKYNEASKKAADRKKSRYHEGDIINKSGSDIKILSLDPDKYPPYVRSDGKKDRRGLFMNMETGEQFVDKLSRVTSGKTGSSATYGEKKISAMLRKLGIKYDSEKRFKDCLGLSNGESKMRFDFYLPGYDMLIEYDGQQHMIGWDDTIAVPFFKTDDSTQAMSCARDILKEAWCVKNNRKLLRIAYIPPKDVNEEWLSKAINSALNQFDDGKHIAYYPVDAEKNYESVHIIMSRLDPEIQMVFADHIADRSYRRLLDENDDEELMAALPTDRSVPPVPIGKKLPLHIKDRKHHVYVRGDLVGNNGVKYLSDCDENGNRIKPLNNKARALFECSCGNHFIASFGAVRGYNGTDSYTQYDGKVCEECTKKRRKQKIDQKRIESLPSPGDIIDPDGNFELIRFMKPLETPVVSQRVLVKEIATGNTFEANYAPIRYGKRLTSKQIEDNASKRQAELEQQRAQQTATAYSIGDVIESKRGRFMVVGLNPDDTDITQRHRVRFKRLSDNREFDAYPEFVKKGICDGTFAVGKRNGDKIGKLGVEFVSWEDEDGNAIPDYIGKTGKHQKQALFRCSCDDHTLFVAPYSAVQENNRLCPKCMEKRMAEMRKKQGIAHRISRVIGEPIDPDGRYIYLGKDEKATTKKEKCIVKDTVTGEVFSALFRNLRAGTVKPPSEVAKARKAGHDKCRKYAIGDIVSPDGNIRIVAELEPKLYQKNNGTAQAVRQFVFRNIETGALFDGDISAVKRGALNGGYSQKTEADYPGIDIFPEPSDE